jgi:hypothetical protein
MKEELILTFEMDGNSWCCYLSSFINLQESPAGFGNTKRAALEDLLSQVDSEMYPYQ